MPWRWRAAKREKRRAEERGGVEERKKEQVLTARTAMIVEVKFRGSWNGKNKMKKVDAGLYFVVVWCRVERSFGEQTHERAFTNYNPVITDK